MEGWNGATQGRVGGEVYIVSATPSGHSSLIAFIMPDKYTLTSLCRIESILSAGRWKFGLEDELRS